MDRRTTFALLLCLLVFAAFTAMQMRFAPKPVPKPAASATAPGMASTPASPETPAPGAAAPAVNAASASLAPATPAVPEREVVLETPLYRATFSNIGARLRNVELKRYSAAWGATRFAENPGKRPKRGHEVPAGDRVELRGTPAFAMDLGSNAGLRSLANVPFAVVESTDASGAVSSLQFVARDSAGLEVRQTWRVRPDTYLFDVDVTGHGRSGRHHGLAVHDAFVAAAQRGQSRPGVALDALHRAGREQPASRRCAGTDRKNDKVREGAVRWAGVQSHYFLALVSPVGADGHAAIMRGASYTPTAEEFARLPKGAKPTQPVAEATLAMVAPAAGSQRFAVYFGPADYFSLAKLSGAGKLGSLQLEKAVDLGMTWMLPFSYPLLQLLRLIDSWVHNFGVAILLLATVVRLALHPLNMSSMKSMRAMQKLQPEMERIKERYKNKPEEMNKAVMALYKDNKVNPAGGCLPMVLQMPLFFALYAVLFNAIDLRQAPFVAWIHDLSAPDHVATIYGLPIRVLPLIMAGTGFVQQRLTPTPPQQATTMYLMNFFMLFIFYGLPSGLVFYWTVMNLYTALQQWLAMRGEVGVVVPAATGSVRGKH
jgi:YidC/Oxa1 family membrane protein insertase